MPRVRLVHFDPDEPDGCVARLRTAGYRVDSSPLGRDPLGELVRKLPRAVVIDLSRSPATGRDLAVALRSRKATRHLPLVFVEGDPTNVKRIEKLLPDAVYTSRNRIRGSLRRAIERPPAAPVVPESVMAGYSGTPLVRKLGIKPGSVVALVGAPEGFEQTLGQLPDEVTLRRSARGASDLMIWFPRSRGDLQRRARQLGSRVGAGGLWIAWPKQASGVATDVTQGLVRRTGLASGLVDYKICAIDATWSALRFAVRKKTR